MVSLLIVGAGSRGATFADWALRHPGAARVVAVAEPRDAYRDRLGDAHGIPAERRFRDWREAVAGGARIADAAVIATLDRDHAEPALALAELGYALLIEKPLAATDAECVRIADGVARAGVVAAVAHVLRYTPYTRLLKQLLDRGDIGEIVSIQHLEPVGFWHQAHSYVRGNWRREDETGPMVLAKCCHDLDWLGFLVGRECYDVASFGSLRHFRPEQRPAGAGDRCLACAIEPECPYSAKRIYLDRARAGETGWPVEVLAWPPTPENVERALRDGPYGRCVWACDNDVVDHQVVSLRYEGGVTATLTMTAFTRMRDRETRIFGTRGELYGNGAEIEIYDFATDRVTRHVVGAGGDPSDSVHALSGGVGTGGDPAGGVGVEGGHGGGDDGVMAAFVAAVAAGDPTLVSTSPQETLASHRIAFAAETARREGRVVAL
jgi:predicted dehydrogenase